MGEFRQRGGCEDGDGANGKERGGPPGEDVGPEEDDAEDDATEDVGEAAALDEDLQRTDVADRGAAGSHSKDVVDVAGLTGGKGGEDEHTNDLSAQDGEVADAEYDVADQAEHSGLSDLAQVDAGDADQREHGHEDLHRFADGVFGRRGERGVQVRVLDVDCDEQQSSDDGGQAGRPAEFGAGDGHADSQVSEGPRRAPRDDSNLGTDGVSGRHPTM